jgi:hypothetical protein
VFVTSHYLSSESTRLIFCHCTSYTSTAYILYLLHYGIHVDIYTSQTHCRQRGRLPNAVQRSSARFEAGVGPVRRTRPGRVGTAACHWRGRERLRGEVEERVCGRRGARDERRGRRGGRQCRGRGRGERAEHPAGIVDGVHASGHRRVRALEAGLELRDSRCSRIQHRPPRASTRAHRRVCPRPSRRGARARRSAQATRAPRAPSRMPTRRAEPTLRTARAHGRTRRARPRAPPRSAGRPGVPRARAHGRKRCPWRAQARRARGERRARAWWDSVWRRWGCRAGRRDLVV